MKTALIRQPAGLGDIFWLQPLVDDMASRGFEVIYPVCDHYYDVVKKSIKTNNSNFVRESSLKGKLQDVYQQTEEIIEDDFEYHPFDCVTDHRLDSFNPAYRGLNVMEIKYIYYHGLNPDFDRDAADWRKSVTIIRDKEREQKYEESRNISDDKEFIWVNRVFGTPPDTVFRDIELPDNIQIVENDMILENIFDVCGAFEKAKAIHSVETCFCWIAELVNTKADLHLYSRKIGNNNQFHNNSYIDLIYRGDWTKHGCL